MFSALFSSQNRHVLIITINSATFQYSNDGTTWTNIPIDGKTITYDSLNYQVRLLSVEPADATYSSSIPLPISQQGQTAQAVITGTGSYTGSIISPNLTISASPITIAPSDSTSFSYNGSSKTVGYTVSGVYAADTNYAVSGTSSTNAGSYTASLTTTSSNYILGTTTTIPWVITKALLTLTTSNKSMTYGSSVPTQTFGYSLSGLLGGDTSNVITGVASHSTTATSSSNIGSHPITTNISGLSATNYTFATVGGTLTISPATLTASTITGSATYTGSAQSVTVLSGINGTYTGSTSVSGTNAGSYTTTITGTGNYTGSVTGTLTISPTTLTASTRTGSATFNGDSQTVTVLSGINGTYTGSTSVSGTNAGSYTTTITGTGNYTGSVTGTLTISPATITFEGTGESRTYNGSTQSVGYIVGGAAMNNYNYTISGISATNAGTYTATITTTYSNYVISPIKNSFTWTMHPAPASSSPASGITTYQVYDGSPKSASVISGLSGLSYSGSSVASGVNAGTYSATVTLGGNYSGNVTGYLVISQAVGDISLYFGGYVAAGDTNTKLFINYLQRANATYTWSASVSGPGAGDAYLQHGFGVESRSYATSGFVVTITATISDPNYTASSATTSITFEAYVPPPSGGGGYGGGGGFIAE